MAPGEEGYFSRVFLVPKKSGGYRLVIDLSQLNKSLAQIPFSMDTLHLVKLALKQGMWATSLDLSDAYHHIPMRPSSQVYLCFQVGVRYKYLVLPFGLSSGPWLFTEVVRQVKKWAWKKDFALFQYLDDWLNLDLDKGRLHESTQRLVTTCQGLGLLVNIQKSELVPQQVIVFLGEKLDLIRGKAFATEERQIKVRKAVEAMVSCDHVSLPQAESLLGLLVATYPTVPWGRLHLRRLQAATIKALRKGRALHPQVKVTESMRCHLKFWLQREVWIPGVPFHPVEAKVTLFTDASLQGWGVVCNGRTYEGRWPEHMHQHINWYELKAVLIALTIFQFQCRNKSVLCMIDNSTAVAYVNRQGGTRSKPLMELMLEVGQVARSMNCTLKAKHIAGKANVLADLASRAEQVIPSEWKLSPEAFEWVCNQSPWGKPGLELFANSMNHHLDKYVSPCPDPKACQA